MKTCTICGSSVEVVAFKKGYICKECILKIKTQTKK